MTVKVTYLKLQNFAGLYVGSGREEIEIDFTNSKNKVIGIVGSNGCGKTCLISTITPFAHTTSLDDRSTLSLVLKGKDGYKEIRYVDGNNEYIIKHYYKASKDTHSVKSYFMKNGEELNENGNVSSFNDMVFCHMGLNQEMMRLVRIGTNVDSFISLTPAKRKEYIGRLIEELNLYAVIYKKINDDIRVVKTMLQAANTNLYNCHISDVVVEEERLESFAKSIVKYEKDRDQIISKISKLNALIKDNDIEDLRRKQHEALSSLEEFKKNEKIIVDKGLVNKSIDDLARERTNHSNQRIDIQSKINSYRLGIDSNYKNIERLENTIKRIISDNDIQSLMNSIQTLRDYVNKVPSIIKDFNYLGDPSEVLYQEFSKFQSFNQISKMILTLNDTAINTYLQLRIENKNVDSWLKEKANKKLSSMNTDELNKLIDKVFAGSSIISPNCVNEFEECPFYKLYDVVSNIKADLDKDNFDSETLNAINVINNNVCNILNEIDRLGIIKIPDNVKNELTESRMLDRLGKHLPFFDLSSFEEYLSLLKEYELYVKNVDKLSQYEKQLSMYKKAGADSSMEEIKRYKDEISMYNNEINKLNTSLNEINILLDNDDSNITTLTKYNDGLKYKEMFESSLAHTEKILKPLENASDEKKELEFELRQITNLINMTREDERILSNKINEYKRLLNDVNNLAKKNKDLSIIQEAVSTKKGIPVIYMKRYLTKIQTLANELLSIIYEGEFKLSKFNVTTDTFEVPYIKNGKKIPDIKYGSQSELALATMALSFALSKNSTASYNILLLDELDAGLDTNTRSAFLKMLYTQMSVIKSEQVFIISHNLSQMVNVPMDIIKLSETDAKSKLQNTIFE